MAAFRSAVDDWAVDMIETDAQITRDGRVVLIHDETVDRTTDGTGRVDGMEWAELRELDAGYRFRDLAGETSFRGTGVRVPLLEELLETLPDVRINVESKRPEVAGPLVETIRRCGAEHRVLVAAEFEHTRRAARGYGGPWGASRRDVTRAWVMHVTGLGAFHRPTYDILQIPERFGVLTLVTRRFVEAAHGWNVPVHVWVVDDEADMRRLLELGVDGIQTDRPDVAARVLRDVAGRPPAPALLGEPTETEHA